MRAMLIRLSVDEYSLFRVTHQIAFDAESASLCDQELQTLCQAFVAGQPSPLPALPMQYADYALWQREHWQDTALQKALAYWKQQLAHAPTVTVIFSSAAGLTMSGNPNIQWTASDPDGNALSWSSDKDGALGTGRLLEKVLSSGRHTITLTAADSNGASNATTIQLTVARQLVLHLPTILR